MFLHGSWMHLLGNMWFLWLFGNNIEDSMTRPASSSSICCAAWRRRCCRSSSNPASAVPMVGASGAISGVMGAYLVLFPRVRVFTLMPLGFYLHDRRAAGVGDADLLGGPAALRRLRRACGDEGGGVAFWAHVGGFVAGVVLVKLFERPDAWSRTSRTTGNRNEGSGGEAPR